MRDVLGPVAQDYVRRRCAESETGVGPSWSQLGRDLEETIYQVVARPPTAVPDTVRLEWRRLVVQTLMPMLREAGWIDYDTNRPGSLRPAPPALLADDGSAWQSAREEVVL
jgi:hypothetical protein